MTTRRFALALAITVALGTGPAFPEHEGPGAHAKGATHTIVLDGEDIRPSSVTMSHGDSISFLNYAGGQVELTFVEPKDLATKIRCHLVSDKEQRPADAPPWALFTWRGGNLVAQVPPGQFASICSLAPGKYAFTARKIGQSAPADGRAVLPAKGQITVS
jgi:hypothetical protein